MEKILASKIPENNYVIPLIVGNGAFYGSVQFSIFTSMDSTRCLFNDSISMSTGIHFPGVVLQKQSNDKLTLWSGKDFYENDFENEPIEMLEKICQPISNTSLPFDFQANDNNPFRNMAPIELTKEQNQELMEHVLKQLNIENLFQ